MWALASVRALVNGSGRRTTTVCCWRRARSPPSPTERGLAVDDNVGNVGDAGSGKLDVGHSTWARRLTLAVAIIDVRVSTWRTQSLELQNNRGLQQHFNSKTMLRNGKERKRVGGWIARQGVLRAWLALKAVAWPRRRF